MQAEREELLERERAAAGEQLVERRAVEVLEHEVREAAVEHGAEAAHDDRVGERGRRSSASRSRSRSAVASVAMSGRRTLATSTARRCSSQTRNAS